MVEDGRAWRDEDTHELQDCYSLEGYALLPKQEPKSTQRKDPRKSESGLLVADVGK